MLLRSQRRRARQAFYRRHFDVRGAVTPGGLEPEYHAPGAAALKAVLRLRWARDAPAQLLQPLAPAGIAPCP